MYKSCVDVLLLHVECHTKDVLVNGEAVKLHVWDTGGTQVHRLESGGSAPEGQVRSGSGRGGISISIPISILASCREHGVVAHCEPLYCQLLLCAGVFPLRH